MVLITPIELHAPDSITSDSRDNVGRVAGTFLPVYAATLLAADVLALAASLGVASLLVGNPGAITLVMAGLAGAAVLGFAMRHHYSQRLSRTAEARDVVGASLAGLLVTGFVAYALRIDAGLAQPVAMWVLSGPAVLLARAVLQQTGRWQRQFIIVGSGDMVAQAARLLLDDFGHNYAIAGVLHPERLGLMQRGRWSSILQQHQAEFVVLATENPQPHLTEWLVRDRVPFAIVPRPNGLPVLGFTSHRLLSHDAVMWSYRDNLRQPVARGIKTAVDLTVALGLLIFLAPVLALIAAAIKLDGGKVLYAHRRLGMDGRSFPCLKFRSMVPNSDAILQDLLTTDASAAAEWAATHKLRNDPRITWIGRFLRQSSLDELPQLFNILRMEMSLVGPRPIVAAEVPRYGEDIHHYYAIRPGLTGLWQISGRSDTGYAQRVWLDTWYVKNWSLWNDFSILVKTVPAVLKRKGAL